MAVLRPVRLGRRHLWRHLYDAAAPRHVANGGLQAPGNSAAADRLRRCRSLLVTPSATYVTVLGHRCVAGFLGRLCAIGSVQ